MEQARHFIETIAGSVMSLSASDAIKMLVMWGIGGVLICLAICKDMEPSLLLPMGLGPFWSTFPFGHHHPGGRGGGGGRAVVRFI